MKVLFFGTPDIAVPFLKWLHQNHTVVGVVTKPDEPVGRGYRLTPPPVKTFAEEKKIPVFQPDGKWTPDKIDVLKKTKAQVGVVVAFGRLLPKEVFSAPSMATFNIHFSLLPQYRGAGPLQWSLINGDTKTGVTAFWIEEGLDSGPICGQAEIPIDPEDNAPTLKEKLIEVGIKVTEKVMQDLSAGKVVKNPQKGTPTHAPTLKKEDGQIHWEKPAEEINNLIRGVYEWPGAFTEYLDEKGSAKKLKIFKATPRDTPSGPPGKITEEIKNEGFIVHCGKGALLVKEVQPEGKKRMPAWAYWIGSPLKVGVKFH